MASLPNLAHACVDALLARALDDQQERRALDATVQLFTDRDGRDWWTRLGTGAATERLLVYTFARAFASPQSTSLASVFKDKALVCAYDIPALAATRSDGCQAQAQQLLDRWQIVPWVPEALAVLCRVLQQIEDPRVRQYAIAFSYRVVQCGCSLDESDEWLTTASDLLLLGIADVWSAVRKQSAPAAAAIVCLFPTLRSIDAFASALLKMASSDDWKVQEGALLALTALVAVVTTEIVPAATLTTAPTSTSSRTADLIKGGISSHAASLVYHLGERHRALSQLPRSLTLQLKPTLYTALKHSQLSVREAAAVCLVRYLEICDESTRVLSFQEVMSKLNRLAPEPLEPTTTTDDSVGHVELLDAAEAEGLLDVLAKLVPYVPVAFLVRHWKFVFPTLERYVVHVASTVRLRSSAVVLALAERARVDEGANATAASPSIELLYHMLLALADTRERLGVCWQRLEGRLLSVDLLVGLLGKDHLWRRGTHQCLLHFVARPRLPRSPSVERWLPDALAAQATWSLDEDEQQRFQRGRLPPSSLLERLNVLVDSKQLAASELWQRVLRGWLRQTREAFDSTQFELRRIARQVLPGLVRLCLWCGQLPLVHEANTSSHADAKPAASGSNAQPLDPWAWSCRRHAVLHAQRVRESSEASSLNDTQDAITNAMKWVTDAVHRAPLEAATSMHEPDAVVARVETIVLTSLLGDPGTATTSAVVCAFRDVYASLPVSFQHAELTSVPSTSSSRDGSLDRQFSVALVTLLPVIVERLVVGTNHTLDRDLNRVLWRMVERVILSWLATDDMFRWITIDKHVAQTSLLLALRSLLASPVCTTTATTSDDVAFLVRTLESAVPVASSSQRVVKDTVADVLVDIYALLWRVAVASSVGTRIRSKLLTTLALLHNQKFCTAKYVKMDVITSNWDDWDGEDEVVGAKGQELRPTSALEDGAIESDDTSVVSLLRRVLSLEQIDAMAQELQQLVSSDSTTRSRHHDALVSFYESLGCLVHDVN